MYIYTDTDGHIQGYNTKKCGTKAKDDEVGYECKYHANRNNRF